MVKLRLLLGMGAVTVACAVCAASASADPTAGPKICPGTETAITGSYGTLAIRGDRYVPAGALLQVRGHLVIAPGACLDAFTQGTVTVRHGMVVGEGSILALGCTPTSIGDMPPCDDVTTHDTVGGSIFAGGALTMYLDGDTIDGDVVSIGGGPGPVLDPYVNFPIKDNVIHGNVFVNGWQGAWFGFIRNVVDQTVVLTHNAGVAIGDLNTPDSTEVVSNTISGDLICRGNQPPAQVGDSGGSPNTVTGRKIGQCAGL